MSAQINYNEQTPRIHGSLNNLNASEVISLSAEVVLAFGLALKRGTDKEQQAGIAGSADFVGISIRDLSQQAQVVGGNVADYQIGTEASVLRQGYINLTCPTGCTAGDPVKYNDTTGVIDSGVAVAGETNIVGATWEHTVSAGGVSSVRLPSNPTVTAGA